MTLNPDKLALFDQAGSGGIPSEGVGGHVLDFLGYFDRPRNAVATAVQEGLSDDPNQSAAGGFYRGLMGDKQTSWGDVVGLGRGTEDMGWPEWLAREGGRLAMDVAGDPLNVAFAPAKAGKLLGGTVKALGVPEGRSIAGLAASAARLPQAADYIERTTGLGKMFRTGPGDDVALGIVNAGKRDLGATEQFIKENQAVIAAALKEQGVPADRMADIFSGLERKGVGLPEDLSPDILKLFDPLVQKHNELFAARNAARVARGMEPIEDISGPAYQHISHIRTDIPLDAGPKSRTLSRWTTEEGVEPVPGFVSSGKAEDMKARGFYKDKASGEWYHRSDPQSFVGPERQVDIGQIYKEGAMPKGSFIEDPASALGIGIKRSQQEITYLKMLDDLEKSGKLINIKNPSMLTKEYPTLEQSMQMTGQTGGAPQRLPEGFRQLLAPGMQEYAAPWKLANFIENQAYVLDKSSSVGAIHEALAPIFKGRMGKVFDEGMQTWKRNVLAHPGFIAGNAVTNPAMAYAHGDVGPLGLVRGMYEAIKVQLGKGAEILGVEPAALKKEFSLRGIDPTHGTGQYGAEEVGKAGGGFLRRNLPEYLQPIATGAELYGKHINDNLFTVSNAVEQNTKLSVAINWLRNNAPDFATKSPEEKASLLDRAAQKGHDALINYDASTPFRKDVLQKLFPFERWFTGMTGATIDTALNKPQRLANLGRFYDTLFEPLSPEDKAISDKWIQEQAPTQGILGTSYDTIAEKLGFDTDPMAKNMLLAGRGIPQQNLEGIMKRPLDTAMSMLSPAFKTPYELLANRNTFKDQPIDPIAGGGLQSLVNPLIGRPYAKAGQETFGAQLPAGWQYALGQSPLGRTTNEMSTAGRGFGITDQDPYKQEMGPAGTIAWGLTGGKILPFDAAKQRQHREYEYKQQIQEVKSRMNFAVKRGDSSGAEYYMGLYNQKLQQRPGQPLTESGW